MFFADNMIAYLENPQNVLKNYYKQQKTTKIQLPSNYKIHMQKALASMCTNNIQIEYILKEKTSFILKET